MFCQLDAKTAHSLMAGVAKAAHTHTHTLTNTHLHTHAHHKRHTLTLQTNKHWRNFAAISKSFFFSNFYFCFFFFSLSSQAFAAAAVEADADGDVVICICNQKVAHKLCFMLIFERTHTHTHKELDDRHFNVPRPAPSHTWNRKNEHRMQRRLRASCLNISISEEEGKGG